MPQRAHVTSVDALESFRASLIVYVSQARSALEEISGEVVRTRLWLENDQRTCWENQLRRRRRDLDEAQQALFSSRISNLRHESALEQMAVHRAKRAVDEAESKLRLLKQWAREFESRVQPQVKQMEKLHTVLTNDMVQAAAYLSQAIQTLTAYAEIHGPGFAAGAGTPPEAPAGPAEKSETR
jgi:hypothetical protein